MTPNYPAPAFDCATCTRHIGKRAGHFLLCDDRVICGRCLDTLKLWDELESMGTRAGMAAFLGRWPLGGRRP